MNPNGEKGLLELVKENNKILKKMRRSMMWSRIVRTIYILIILGVTFGAYYLVQPYLESILGTYSSLLGTTESVQQAGNSLPDVSKILDIFGN